MELVKYRIMIVKRFDIWLVSLDPITGAEMAKTRPCVVVSPNSINRNLKTILIAPLTHTQKTFPTRVACKFQNQTGEIALDQMRTVDKAQRLIQKIGILDAPTSEQVCQVLTSMFEY